MLGPTTKGWCIPKKRGREAVRKERKQVTKRGTARPPGPAYWLITRNENGRIEVLTIHLGEGEEALALFSFEEEAQMYLGFEASGDGWRTRETRAGELVSVLLGCCAHVGCVTLDPLPQMITDETARLLTLDRKSFVRDLLDESELKGGAARGLRTRHRKRSAYSTMLDYREERREMQEALAYDRDAERRQLEEIKSDQPSRLRRVRIPQATAGRTMSNGRE
jgi:hypothetical protein